jgi:hypothetical protein
MLSLFDVYRLRRADRQRRTAQHVYQPRAGRALSYQSSGL